jgi:hypothetical protein
MKSIQYLLLALLSLVLYLPASAQTSGTLTAEAPKHVTFEAPLLITDIGQGNSSKLIEALLKRSGDFEFKSESTARADALAGVKTLIIGVGASSKGLGAAGLNAEQEYERAKALLQAAEDQKIPVIGVHIGGIPRRGELSDRFNRQVLEKSVVFVAWDGGNEDKFFTTAAEESDVPLLLTNDKRAVGEMLTTLLKEGYTRGATAAQPKP